MTDTKRKDGWTTSNMVANPDPRDEEIRELRAALRDCELNLRVLHNATGQKEEWDPAVKPTFEVWKNARALLSDTEDE